MLKVINLWAGPGAGKSTTAAAVFARMKRLRFSAELVTEYAKDLTYERSVRLKNQFLVLAEQYNRLKRLEGHVEYAITDSPLPLSLIYSEDHKWLRPLVDQLWGEFQNYSFFVERTKAPYVESGRNQTLDEAKALDVRIRHLADEYGPNLAIDPDSHGVEDVVIREVNYRRVA